MARPGELVLALRTVGLMPFLKRLNSEIAADNLMTWAAAMAYSWLFAIFPFMLALLTFVPLLPAAQKEFAREKIEQAVNQLPRESQATIGNWLKPNLKQILDAPPRGALSVGLLVTIWAASGGMAMTMAALDMAYDVTKSRKYIKQRSLAVVLTIVVAALILAVIVLIPIGTVVTGFLVKYADRLHLSWPLLIAWQVARYALALVLMFAALAILYYYGTNRNHTFHWVTAGSLFCVAVWIILGMLFRLYVDKYGRYGQTYGTVGGVIVLLFFFYLDALVLLIGAEINAEVDDIMQKANSES
jgi:membrane protein